MPGPRLRIPPTPFTPRRAVVITPPVRAEAPADRRVAPAPERREEPSPLAPPTRPAPGAPAIDARAARAALLRAALENPEIPFSSAVPPEITEPDARAEHLKLVLGALVKLREKSFYDSGVALRELMTLRSVYGAKDLRELVEKADLPMSHMSATRWMTISAVFDRATAIQLRQEKAYGLIQYAHATGRAPAAAVGILSRNEVLAPTDVRAKAATGAQVREAIDRLRAAVKPPPAVPIAELEDAAEDTEKLARELGFAGATGRVDDRGRIQLTIPLATALRVRAQLPDVIARWARKQAKAQPSWMTKVLKGWKPKV